MFLPPCGSEQICCYARRLSLAVAADRFWFESIGRDEGSSLVGSVRTICNGARQVRVLLAVQMKHCPAQSCARFAVIPFHAEIQRIRETIETVPEERIHL
jgi:hypothetical protein